MKNDGADIKSTEQANRASLVFTAVMEMLGVGGLAIYAAYCRYWQLVIVSLGYIAYVIIRLRYNLRNPAVAELAVGDRQPVDGPSVGARQANPSASKNDFRFIKSTPKQRKLAGVLALAYAALMGLAFYLESIRIEDRWPVWLLWVGGVTGFAILLVLPFVIVQLFFGLDLFLPRRFTLRGMLRTMFWASLVFWYCTQMYWIIERQQWRASNRAAIVSTDGAAPPALRLLRESGESRIEIKNGTQKQLAEAKRLFPEATVVAVEDAQASGGSRVMSETGRN